MPRSKNTHPIIPTVTLRPALNDGAINKMLHHGPSATNADMKAEHGFDKRFTQSALYVDNKRKRHANLWRLFNTSDSFRYEEHRLGNHTQLQPSGRTPQHMEVHPSNISATNAIEERGSHASSLLPTMNATNAIVSGARRSESIDEQHEQSSL